MRRDQGIIRAGEIGHPRALGSGAAGRMVRPVSRRRSDFITTRCYSPAGVQIWDGDHGSTVYALAVSESGAVYQSGAGGLSGDAILGSSLFTGIPLVTAMRPGGYPIWGLIAPDAHEYSYGIAVGQDGYLYYSSTNENEFPFTAYVAKVSQASGEDLLHLPLTGFYAGTSGRQMGRVKCDADGNPYAIFRTIQGAIKWVADTEYWMFNASHILGVNVSGLDVSDSGNVYVSSQGSVFGGPGSFNAFYILDSSTGNLDPVTVPPIIDTTAIDITGITGPVGYRNAACSRDGTQWFSFNLDAHLTGTIDEAAWGAVGSPLLPYAALAINSSGRYCVSLPRTAQAIHTSHYVFESDATLVFSADHGADVYDAIILEDGTTIIAGGRVRRSDFP